MLTIHNVTCKQVNGLRMNMRLTNAHTYFKPTGTRYSCLHNFSSRFGLSTLQWTLKEYQQKHTIHCLYMHYLPAAAVKGALGSACSGSTVRVEAAAAWTSSGWSTVNTDHWAKPCWYTSVCMLKLTWIKWGLHFVFNKNPHKRTSLSYAVTQKCRECFRNKSNQEEQHNTTGNRSELHTIYFMCTYTHEVTHVDTHMHTNTHTHTQAHGHTHTHANTHTHAHIIQS